MKANYGLTLVSSLILTVATGAATGGSVGRSAGSSDELNVLLNNIRNGDVDPAVVMGIFIAVLGIVMVAVVFATIFDAFIMNPLEVGCQNFFIENSEGRGDFSALSRGFSPSWINNVGTMFLKDLFIVLWSCLFIIPGIIKGYSYRLVPYIMAENPEMKGTEAITLSRKLMNGNKWDAFVFDLSFIGWSLLSVITCGLVGVFYATPYYNCSCAELYKALKEENAGTVTAGELR